ncbi:hypothetical protein VTJ83DRAFT_3503 [Remersonia thermophila]|uniref:ABC transporter domain-containing protein n=1 Tax=Remersonia thermophila TaxID=72144 RepID=A0ABR4DE97_9PEZI
MADALPPPTIETNNLTYTFPDHTSGVSGITLSLPSRSRTLLVGANGAGKTTLLRLLAGKRLAPRGAIRIAGLDPFQDALAGDHGVAYLGLEWVLSDVVRRDVSVKELLRSVGGDAYPDRRDELVQVLDIDAERWRMHAVSDGERRRVQLAMGLLRPWRVLLLDEITVDLDVWSRAQFLGFLRRETETRDCTIVYATHILDNLAGWPTHLVHMHLGRVKEWGLADEFLRRADQEKEQEGDDGLGATGNSRLGELVLRWLKQDLKERGPRNRVQRGPEGLTYAVGGLGGYGYEPKGGKDGGEAVVEAGAQGPQEWVEDRGQK